MCKIMVENFSYYFRIFKLFDIDIAFFFLITNKHDVLLLLRYIKRIKIVNTRLRHSFLS